MDDDKQQGAGGQGEQLPDQPGPPSPAQDDDAEERPTIAGDGLTAEPTRAADDPG